jgi:hypothetical protein
MEVLHVLTNGISGSLVPCIGLMGLLSSKNLNKSVGEGVKDIRVGNVVMKGSRIELGQDVNLPDFTVDTV